MPPAGEGRMRLRPGSGAKPQASAKAAAAGASPARISGQVSLVTIWIGTASAGGVPR